MISICLEVSKAERSLLSELKYVIATGFCFVRGAEQTDPPCDAAYGRKEDRKKIGHQLEEIPEPERPIEVQMPIDPEYAFDIGGKDEKRPDAHHHDAPKVVPKP